jgi:hypothetical protein
VAPRDLAPPTRERAWLRAALERLAVTDPPAAGELLVALLPAQALLAEHLVYHLVLPAGRLVRVELEPGSARVQPDPRPGPVEATVRGSLAALAPLAAGDAGWRLGDLRVDGSRRRIRRLLRARRRPVTLADLALVAPPPPPRPLLTALAAVVEPAWTAGHRFGVSYSVAGHGRHTVVVDGGRPLRVLDNGGGHPHAATVEVSPAGLVAVLAGQHPPAGEHAEVAGDARALEVLHAWFDRARGVAGG